ncbi:MAG TPA: 23S rRNA (pseudouridine(1915)-N(3))-methyltransferase RlmH [Acholeplasmataceae bacterium]|nr:23S rRNA (pseudouridine(1915)-N(3))-methyltransferase RlmH [Acholeplasmataceae bacterium]
MTIIAVGKLQTAGIKASFEHYHKQLKHVKVIEIKESNIQKESLEILKHIKDSNQVIVCAIEGKEVDTYGFCALYQDHLDTVFVVGGSEGLDDSVKAIAKHTLSFSKMTFPHQLARLMLMEQIFRCEKIKQHHPYHK